MREKLSLDRNWRFAYGHAASDKLDFDFLRSRDLVKAGEARGAANPHFDDSNWQPINIPHDFVIDLPLDQSGDKELADHGFHCIGPDHPESSVGWYRRSFDLCESDLGRRLTIEFDGVFRDSVVWVNGHRLGRHQSGYTSFRYDITDVANYNGRNVVTVRADASSYEGWWYEGGGIYRHVWLVKTAPVHIAPWGVFVTSEVHDNVATVTIKTKIINDGDHPATFTLQCLCLAAPRAGRDDQQSVLAESVTRDITIQAGDEIELSQQVRISNPNLWSPDTPNLYRILTKLNNFDSVETPFGIRTLHWDPNQGFFLNNKHVKIKGTCNHQHHAGVGIAMPDRLQSLRIEKLKEMGSNAYRCSHYAATPELLDACDRLGMLVMAENRLAGSSPEQLAQLESMILRDRNHPSIILWSLANEEHTIQWAKSGERIGKSMLNLCHKLDPTRKVTSAMHDRGLGAGLANVVDVHGWNYIKVGNIEAFHARRPEQPIIGSEEGSTVCTRGIYADDETKGYVSAYDARTPGWGMTAEKWWTFYAAQRWLAGAFVWTGFDYYGEPIPYKWPCTASHFGLMDLCGFPKDNYYYYKSWWGTDPVLHILPHWNWPGREGVEIDVRCFSNCEKVELFLNDKSLGAKDVPKNSHVSWKVPYEPGTLLAKGLAAPRAGRVASIEAKIETTGKPTKLVLIPERTTINADGEDLSSITLSVLDPTGRPVPTADNQIHFEITGPGHLLGVGNGDPSSHESDKSPQRKLFNGLALLLVQSTCYPGTVRITAKSPGLDDAAIFIESRSCPLRPSIP
jgi:beta-galactosidase